MQSPQQQQDFPFANANLSISPKSNLTVSRKNSLTLSRQSSLTLSPKTCDGKENEKKTGSKGETRKKSAEEIRTHYNDTEAIDPSGIFDQGHKDDYYYRNSLQDAQKVEKELFYDENDIHARFDQEKLNKVLVGTYMIWTDDKYDTLFPKIELLVEAKADINTTWGGGIFRSTLLERTFYGKHKKLKRALVKVADPLTLEPRVGKSIFSLACERCDYSMMKILIEKNCEPNRIGPNGTTPLITLCLHYTHEDEDIDHKEQLKCIELLVNFEGPDARSLKAMWANKWEEVCPEIMGTVWREVADFCIPNINVRPAFRGETAQQHLRSYKNPTSFTEKATALLGHLFNDAWTQKEKYWPRDRDQYKRLFNSKWE